MKEGDIVTLKDGQTLQGLIDEDKFTEEGLNLTICCVRECHVEDVATWQFVEFNENELLLVVKIVGDDSQYKICFKPDVIKHDTINQLYNLGYDEWLFVTPKGPWEWDDINLSNEIESDGAIFTQDELGTVYGSADIGVTEWHTEEDVENPELLVLETGEDINTYIEFYQGCNVNEKDIEIMGGNHAVT